MSRSSSQPQALSLSSLLRPSLAAALLLAGSCASDQSDLPEDPPTGPAATTTTAAVTSVPSDEGSTPDLTGKTWKLQEVATASAPIALTFDPTDGDAYLAEREGVVWLYSGGFESGGADDGGSAPIQALDLGDDIGEIESEQGLLGIAISPEGDKLVANFTDGDRGGATTVAMFDLAEDGTADHDSRVTLMVVEQPFANHNGGNVIFGPDGTLYIGFGDGGSQGDPSRNGQNSTTILGSLIRIDPLNTTDDDRYVIPPDNPFIDGGGRPEIVATGLRNPWRFSFDRTTGDLWLADVGGSEIEEINRVALSDLIGANFGWNTLEGTRNTGAGTPPAESIVPVFEYDHSIGSSITGGYRYRGSAVAGLSGSYLYSDFIAGGLNVLSETSDGTFESTVATDLAQPITSVAGFGEDPAGELYIVSLEGTVWKIVAR